MSEEKIPVFSRLREAGDIGEFGLREGPLKKIGEKKAPLKSQLVNQILF